MPVVSKQERLFDEPSGAQAWDDDVAKHALDELFRCARRYKSSVDYKQLLLFITRFRLYSPFNAMLVHTQMHGATYVAPPRRWERDYFRRIRIGAQPLVILQPKGPVLFVFDVSDTEPIGPQATLPAEIEAPFAVGGRVGKELEKTILNARRDGIGVGERKEGSQSAGSIRPVPAGKKLQVLARERPTEEYVEIEHRYEILLNSQHSREVQYSTLVHELAHLYCGHLGTPNPEWWPDRRGLPHNVREIEAESVSHLVCERLSLSTYSDKYLSSHLESQPEMPDISLDRVLKSAGLIEQMAGARMPLRR